MHESIVRLLNYARKSTANEKKPVLDFQGLSERLEVSSARMTNWKTRGISKDGALKAEVVFGCSATWLMTGAIQKESERDAAFGMPTSAGTDDLLQRIGLAPVIAWANLRGVMLLNNEKPEVIGAATKWERVHRGDAGERAKFVEVQDDALKDRCNKGSLLLIDPDAIAEPGCIVLASDEAGELYLRQYKFLGSGVWEATSTRPAAFAPIPGFQLKILGRATQLVSLEP